MTPMNDLPLWIILVPGVFAALAIAGLLAWQRARRLRNEGVAPLREAVHMTCPTCQHPLVVSPLQMTPLSPAEIGLVVRGKPAWVKRKLADYECPHCSAAHVFAIDSVPPAYLGADLYTPHARGLHCMECHKTMQRPVWARGEYDKRLQEAPLSMDHGLECQFCKAVFCYECAERTSRHKKKDGTLFCPRCHRYPVEHVFHP